MRARAFFGVLALAGLLAACEAGAGDLCQRNSDCQDPLICVRTTRQCAPAGSSGDLDGSVIYDASFWHDAQPVVDAASEPDAAPVFDAAPAFDAAPIDAAPIDAAP